MEGVVMIASCSFDYRLYGSAAEIRDVHVSGSIEIQMAAIDGLLERLIPLLNQISVSAFFVQQGQMEKARPVEDELNRWLAKNRGSLPESVTASVSRLSSRITDWMMNLGTSASVEQLATDKHASFAEVTRALTDYKKTLAHDLDTREEALRVRIAKAGARNPWVSGSFYLTVAVAGFLLLLLIVRTAPWWAYPPSS